MLKRDNETDENIGHLVALLAGHRVMLTTSKNVAASLRCQISVLGRAMR
jgi:hypothetical protein